jgi:ribosome-associated heat shock protein Hsp15
MNGRAPTVAANAVDGLRLDKWLWHARFFKSRTLAAKQCAAGRVRINRQPAEKAHHTVRPGDVLTFPQGNDVRVVRILALGVRRGPAPEARTLYEDLSPPAPRRPAPAQPARREKGAGRPTKAERRETDRLKDV